MYYTVYKTSNLINGKFYVGTHKTKDPNDDYLGSGKLLRRAIEKYGVENFKKEILFCFDNPKDMFDKEREIVSEEFLSENNTYNLKIGGEGGWDYLNKTGIALRTGAKLSSRQKEKFNRTGKKCSQLTKQKISVASRKRSAEIAETLRNANKGVPKSEEQRRKISESVRLAHKRRIESLVDCDVANVD
jgi:hypothetical protein